MKYFLIAIKSFTCDLIGYNRLGNNVVAHTRMSGIKTGIMNFPNFQPLEIIAEKLSHRRKSGAFPKNIFTVRNRKSKTSRVQKSRLQI